jgi:hypothetical protein
MDLRSEGDLFPEEARRKLGFMSSPRPASTRCGIEVNAEIDGTDVVYNTSVHISIIAAGTL